MPLFRANMDQLSRGTWLSAECSGDRSLLNSAWFVHLFSFAPVFGPQLSLKSLGLIILRQFLSLLALLSFGFG